VKEKEKKELQSKTKVSEYNGKYLFYQQQIGERDNIIQQMKTVLDVKINIDYVIRIKKRY